MSDVGVDDPFVAEEIPPPDSLQQLPPAVYPAGVCCERGEEIEFEREELIDRRGQIRDMKGIIDGQNQLLETIQTNVAPIFNALAATVKSSGISLGKGQEPSVSDFQQPAQRDDRASGGLQNPHDGPA